MLGWLTGSSYLVAPQNTTQDDDAVYHHEPPETPAHIFAVRAFKTAIFGTPAPYRSGLEQPQRAEKTAGADSLLEDDRAIHPKDGLDYSNSKGVEMVRVAKIDPPASPAKGILLTPGTAATRRKTVSFGGIEKKREVETKHSRDVGMEKRVELAMDSGAGGQNLPKEEKPRHSSLTRTLIELSKQRTIEAAVSDPTSNEQGMKKRPTPSSTDLQTEDVLGMLDGDVTLDLNLPRSTSGQHWKAEYDQYHKRSKREMKKIIKYGQNVRSYAAKKDTEATRLSERLRKQVAITNEMEARVEGLEEKLRDAQSSRGVGVGDGANLRKGKAIEGPPVLTIKEVATQTPEINPSGIELMSLREIARAAEDKAAKLEEENAALKLSLARVKNEMMSYETRRQAREERMKKREAKHKAAREESENKLARLTLDYEELLRTSANLPVVDMVAEIQSIQQEAELPDLPNSQPMIHEEPALLEDKEKTQPPNNAGEVPKPYISPRQTRLSKPPIDIWILDSSTNNNENSPPSKEPTELPPSSVKRDLQRTLKEIDQNLIPTHQLKTHLPNHFNPPKPSSPPPKPPTTNPPHPISANDRTRNRKPPIINSPRPSIINLESSPAKLQTQISIGRFDARNARATGTTGRSTSLLSGFGSRTSSLVSRRGGRVRVGLGELPAERVSAAKERLERRRRGERGES